MFRTAPEDAPIPPRALAEEAARTGLPDAASLDRLLTDAAPVQIVRVAREVIGRERLAVVSSFGTESAALLKLVSDVDPAIPVLLVDTGWLFPETLAHRDALVARLGLTDVRSLTPDPNKLEQRDLCGPLVHQPPMAAADCARSSRSPTHSRHSRPG